MNNQDPSVDPERRNYKNPGPRDYVSGIQPSESVIFSDPINHPNHYNDRKYHGEKIEAIDIIELIIELEKNPKVAYNMSNVIKYLLRFRSRGKELEDLKKAKWYLNRMIQNVNFEYTDSDGG